MEELLASGGNTGATDQLILNLTRRGPERDLLPWLAEASLPVMAYSSVQQGRLTAHPALMNIAAELQATPTQVALAWLLARDGVLAILKASSLAVTRACGSTTSCSARPLPDVSSARRWIAT